MPPEYIDIDAISPKFDVFSLGVIILKIMAGNKGYFHCYELPPKQFAEPVSKTTLSVYYHELMNVILHFSIRY